MEALVGPPGLATAFLCSFAASQSICRYPMSPITAPVESLLATLHRDLTIPEAWRREGVEAPTEESVGSALRLSQRLFAAYGIIPYKVTASKEGGVYLAYESPANFNILRIEVDNELDVVAVVSDGKAILASGVLEDDATEAEIIRSFQRDLA
jgi:hypothetical protein